MIVPLIPLWLILLFDTAYSLWLIYLQMKIKDKLLPEPPNLAYHYMLGLQIRRFQISITPNRNSFHCYRLS